LWHNHGKLPRSSRLMGPRAAVRAALEPSAPPRKSGTARVPKVATVRHHWPASLALASLPMLRSHSAQPQLEIAHVRIRTALFISLALRRGAAGGIGVCGGLLLWRWRAGADQDRRRHGGAWAAAMAAIRRRRVRLAQSRQDRSRSRHRGRRRYRAGG